MSDKLFNFCFYFMIVLVVCLVAGFVLWLQSFEVDTSEYQHIGSIYKEYPEMRPTIDKFMSDGYISWHESALVGYELNKTEFTRAKQSVTKEQ